MSIRGDARDIEQVTTEINEMTKDRQGSGGFERQREAPEPMETASAPSDFVVIDWQAAARESVSIVIVHSIINYINCLLLFQSKCRRKKINESGLNCRHS